MNNSRYFQPALNRVHEIPLDSVEYDNREEQHDDHEDKTVQQSPPGERPAAENPELESLENRSQWIELKRPAELVSGSAQRVDDRGGVHEKLKSEANQIAKIAVFGSQRRDDQSP